MLNSISRLRKNPPTQKMIMPTTVANTNLIKSFMTTFVLLRRADTLLSAHDEYSFLAFGGEGRSVLQRYKKTTLAPIRGQHFAAAFVVRGACPRAGHPACSPPMSVFVARRRRFVTRPRQKTRAAVSVRPAGASLLPRGHLSFARSGGAGMLPGRHRFVRRRVNVCPRRGCCAACGGRFRRKNAGKARFRARAFGKCIFKSYLYTNKTPIA